MHIGIIVPFCFNWNAYRYGHMSLRSIRTNSFIHMEESYFAGQAIYGYIFSSQQHQSALVPCVCFTCTDGIIIVSRSSESCKMCQYCRATGTNDVLYQCLAIADTMQLQLQLLACSWWCKFVPIVHATTPPYFALHTSSDTDQMEKNAARLTLRTHQLTLLLFPPGCRWR